MTDGPSSFPFGFMGDPEEMKRQAELHSMAAEATRHEIDEFIMGLDKDKLLILAKLIVGFANDGEGNSLATYFYGGITFILKFKYNICPVHGVNHEDALKEMTTEAPSTEAPVEPLPRTDVELERRIEVDGLIQAVLDANDFVSDDLLIAVSKVPIAEPSTALELQMMNQYNLDDLWDGEGPDDPERKFKGFQCKSCGLFYRSIPDRMLKQPDDCHGCHIKAAHG